MKKLIAAVLTLFIILTLCACGSETYTTEEKIQIADQIVYDSLGDAVLTTDYDEGIYYVVFTFDGATMGYGSSEFFELCEMIDSFSKTLSESGIDNAIIFVDDISNTVPLYATMNGNDITDYLT